MEDAEFIKLFNKEKSIDIQGKGTSFVFSLKNRIGGLARALRVFQVLISFLIRLIFILKA